MSSTSDPMTFARLVGEAYATADGDVERGQLHDELTRHELITTSDCGLIHIFHNGAGGMVDIAIDDEVFDLYDADGLGQAMCVTVQRAESAVRGAWESVSR